MNPPTLRHFIDHALRMELRMIAGQFPGECIGNQPPLHVEVALNESTSMSEIVVRIWVLSDAFMAWAQTRMMSVIGAFMVHNVNGRVILIDKRRSG